MSTLPSEYLRSACADGKGANLTVDEKYREYAWVDGGPLQVSLTTRQGGDLLCDSKGPEWKYNPRFRENQTPLVGADYKIRSRCYKGPKGFWQKCLVARCGRQQYLGDPRKCCIDGTSGDPKKRCSPCIVNGTDTDKRFTSVVCNSQFKSFCGDNWKGNTNCRLWAEANPMSVEVTPRVIKNCENDMSEWCQSWETLNPLVYHASMKKYCAKNNMGKQVCIAYAKKNPGTIDGIMDTYCKTNPNSPLCSCINSPVFTDRGSYSSGAVNPKCIDAKCIRTGYMTQNMIQAACPPTVDCRVMVDIKDNQAAMGIELTEWAINQDCEGKFDINNSPTPVPDIPEGVQSAQDAIESVMQGNPSPSTPSTPSTPYQSVGPTTNDSEYQSVNQTTGEPEYVYSDQTNYQYDYQPSAPPEKDGLSSLEIGLAISGAFLVLIIIIAIVIMLLKGSKSTRGGKLNNMYRVPQI